MNDEKGGINGYFMDDGTPINVNLVKKPSLCVTCKKDDDQNETILCTMNRVDQQNDPKFICEAYEAKY